MNIRTRTGATPPAAATRPGWADPDGTAARSRTSPPRSPLENRPPAFILFAMLTLAPIVTATCAWFFSLTSVIAVAFTAALAAGLAKLALDSTVQREIGEEIRSSAFAVSETLNQVANVAGSLAGVLVSILDNGQAGLAIAAAFLTLALVTLVTRRRRRILGARAEAEAAYAAAERGGSGGGRPPRRGGV